MPPTQLPAPQNPPAYRHGLRSAAGQSPVTRAGIRTSPSTLRRRIAEQALPPVGAVHVLCIGDWAWRKGRAYGTVLVDLGRGRIVDLLPDRSVQGVFQWLRAHLGVEIVSRDRAGVYVDGIRQGAPDALQVPERWYLMGRLGSRCGGGV